MKTLCASCKSVPPRRGIRNQGGQNEDRPARQKLARDRRRPEAAQRHPKRRRAGLHHPRHSAAQELGGGRRRPPRNRRRTLRTEPPQAAHRQRRPHRHGNRAVVRAGGALPERQLGGGAGDARRHDRGPSHPHFGRPPPAGTPQSRAAHLCRSRTVRFPADCVGARPGRAAVGPAAETEVCACPSLFGEARVDGDAWFFRYEIEIVANGGDGKFLWSSSNHSVGVVAQTGHARTHASGAFRVTAAMQRNVHVKQFST